MTTQPSPNEITTSFRLAIVDDDPLFLDRLATTLSYRTGSRVFPVATGDELLALLEREPVDCVVLDYELENETGLAVADRLKAKFRDSPPVVMLTGSGSERTVVKAFRGGFSDYVSKRNLDTQELLRAIHSAVREACGGDRGRQGDRATQEEAEDRPGHRALCVGARARPAR